MRIIVILLSLTALGLSACEGNRLNGSASSSVATGASGFLPLRGQGLVRAATLRLLPLWPKHGACSCRRGHQSACR
jgi:hypothetical protein